MHWNRSLPFKMIPLIVKIGLGKVLHFLVQKLPEMVPGFDVTLLHQRVSEWPKGRTDDIKAVIQGIRSKSWTTLGRTDQACPVVSFTACQGITTSVRVIRLYSGTSIRPARGRHLWTLSLLLEDVAFDWLLKRVGCRFPIWVLLKYVVPWCS